MGVLSFAAAGIEDGADGVALVNPDNMVLDFISYGGSFDATDGPANGMTAADIGVTEAGNGVNLKVKTGMIFPASLSVQVDYVGFEDGQMKLELVIGGMLAKLDGMITQAIESMTLPEGLSVEFPHITIDVAPLLARSDEVSDACVAYRRAAARFLERGFLERAIGVYRDAARALPGEASIWQEM